MRTPLANNGSSIFSAGVTQISGSPFHGVASTLKVATRGPEPGAAGNATADAAKAMENSRERLTLIRISLLTIIHHRAARPAAGFRLD